MLKETLQTSMTLMIKLMTKATIKITHKANASNINLRETIKTIEEIETIATVVTAKEATTTTATTTIAVAMTVAVTVADIKSPGTTIVVIVAIADNMVAMTVVVISTEIEATTSTIVATTAATKTEAANPMRSLTKTQSTQIQTTGCTIRMTPSSSVRHSPWRRVHSTLRFTCSKVIRLVKKTEKWVQTYSVAAKSAHTCRTSWLVFRRWMWT